jgi:hypothetical protein
MEGGVNTGERLVPWMTISCPKCGGVHDVEAWTRRPVTGDLPPGQFQCPGCGFAFQRREVEPGRKFTAGGRTVYIPGKLALVPCAGVL